MFVSYNAAIAASLPFPWKGCLQQCSGMSHGSWWCGAWCWIQQYHKAPLLLSCDSASKLNSAGACPLGHTAAVQAAFCLDWCSFMQSGYWDCSLASAKTQAVHGSCFIHRWTSLGPYNCSEYTVAWKPSWYILFHSTSTFKLPWELQKQGVTMNP